MSIFASKKSQDERGSAVTDYIASSPSLVLLVFRGQPATGKSVLAKALSFQLSFKLIVRDQFKAELAQAGLTPDEAGFKSYRQMWDSAFEWLIRGKSCICDANLNQPVALQEIRSLRTRTAASVLFIDCVCTDIDEHRKRLDSRKTLGLPAGWADSWEKYLRYLRSDYNQGGYPVPYSRLEVDTSAPYDVAAIAGWVHAQSHASSSGGEVH